MRLLYVRGANVILESNNLAITIEQETTTGYIGILYISSNSSTIYLDKNRTKVTFVIKNSYNYKRKQLS